MALVYVESKTGPTMSAHEFMNYEQKIHLKNPYMPIEEKIVGMLDERTDLVGNGPIEEVDKCASGDVM